MFCHNTACIRTQMQIVHVSNYCRYVCVCVSELAIAGKVAVAQFLLAIRRQVCVWRVLGTHRSPAGGHVMLPKWVILVGVWRARRMAKVHTHTRSTTHFVYTHLLDPRVCTHTDLVTGFVGVKKKSH